MLVSWKKKNQHIDFYDINDRIFPQKIKNNHIFYIALIFVTRDARKALQQSFVSHAKYMGLGFEL